MPFEFTGVPPAFASTPTSFSSFSSLATTTPAARRNSADLPSYPLNARSSLGPRPSSVTVQPTLDDTVSAGTDSDPDRYLDPLSSALSRAARKRPAFFGRSAVAGDTIIKAALESHQDLSIATILSDLNSIPATHPTLAGFVHALFESQIQTHVIADHKSPGMQAVLAEEAPLSKNSDPQVTRDISGDQKDDVGSLASLESDEELEQEDKEPSSVPNQPFRFLDLPAEMRNMVYRMTLAPNGHVGLISHHDPRHSNCPSSYAYGHTHVDSDCEPQILATCRQVYDEAKLIAIQDNIICVTASIRYSLQPVILKRLLPDHVLPKLTSLVLVCEASKEGLKDGTSGTQSNWKQLQDMTGLKSLRICLVERKHQRLDDDSKHAILNGVLERIPASCVLSFESKHEAEKGYVRDVMRERDAEMLRYWNPVDASTDMYEAPGELLERLAKPLRQQQGCKSGHARDYRFPERKSPAQLAPLSEADPNLVFGGSL